MIYFDWTNNVVLENCKIKKISKKLFCVVFSKNKITKSFIYKLKYKNGKITILELYDLKLAYKKLAEVNNGPK